MYKFVSMYNVIIDFWVHVSVLLYNDRTVIGISEVSMLLHFIDCIFALYLIFP